MERAARAESFTEAQARKVLDDLLDRLGEGEELRNPSIEGWLREWLKSKEAACTGTTAERYGGIIAAFTEQLGMRAKRPLSALVTRDVQAFADARLKAGLSPTTVTLDAKIIRTALNAARRQGLVQINAAEAVELPDRISVERGTFTGAEIKMLLAAAEGEWKTLILVGYFTGARLSDCCCIEWNAIDLTEGTLTYTQGKSDKTVVLPLHPDLQAHLEQLASSDVAGQFIMPGMADKGPGGRHGLSEGFKRIVRNAGLDLQTVQGGGTRRISKRTFHALRHSFTSALANAEVPPELRMKLTGHSSEAIHRGYTHHELAVLRNAVAKLPSLLSKKK
jgi:integrase